MKNLACSAVTVAMASGLGLSGAEIGPDVVAFYAANSILYHGSSGGIGGYAIGTTSCNYGDMVANWYSGTNNTPLIGQNAYRLKNGRFEQIGLSWLKHSFCALSEGGCGDCQATDCSTLGIGCADTYGAGLNTNPSGPRSAVNAFSGYYEYPFTVSPSGPSSLRGNLQIADSDVEPGQNEGARYFFEAYYMSDDDAAWGNHANNASWREVDFDDVGDVDALGSTRVEEQAIRVWKEIDPSVDLNEAHVVGDGFFLVGAKVTEIGGGMWHYEYAVFNHNCDASAGSFTVPLPDGATVQNIGFNDVDYHSGEIYDGTDWDVEVEAGVITWSTVPYSVNPNANAIRWATMYNFRFDANVAPETSEVTIGTFKPGGPPSTTVSTLAPPAVPVDPCTLPLGNCPSDVNGDTIVDVNDVLILLGNFGDCGDGSFRPEGDLDDDCCVTVNDLLVILGDWDMECLPEGACCMLDGSCAMTSQPDCEGSWSEGIPCDWVDCPQPGACCLADDSCENMLLDVCDAAGGSWRGANTDCEETDCSMAEFNDDCADAWPIYDGYTDFTTAGATTDGPHEEECKYDGGHYNDVWFRYSAACSGVLTISTCNLVNFDSDLAAYAGWTCDHDQMELIGCQDDTGGCDGYSTILNVPVTAGEPYLIRIGGWSTGDMGSGEVHIECN